VIDKVEIKSKIAKRWIKKFWSGDAFILYDHIDKSVTIHCEGRTDNTFPILNSILNSTIDPSKYALEPFKMIDLYKENGYIIASGYNPVTIEALKICIRDLGIKIHVRKIKKTKSYTLYHRDNYKIYLKSDSDYAYFMLYFIDDIITRS